MRVEDLVFEAPVDCCLFNCAAHVRLRSGMELGVTRSEDGNTFGAALYTTAGLFQRFAGLGAADVQSLLDGDVPRPV